MDKIEQLTHLYQNAPTHYITDWSQELSENPEVMIVADKPTKDEHYLQWVWGGIESRYVQSRLITPIFPLQNCFYTYLIKYYVDKKPKKKELQTFLYFLNQEIQIIQPKLILTMGKISGTILQDKNIHNYCSVTTLFNQGHKKQSEFIKFLENLKTGENNV